MEKWLVASFYVLFVDTCIKPQSSRRDGCENQRLSIKQMGRLSCN